MKLFLSSLLFCLPLLVAAQINYWQGGLFLGGAGFSGDVNPQATPDLSEVSLAVGFIGKVDVTPKIGFRGSITYANLVGDDANYPIRVDRGFRFNTTLIELAGVAEWEPFASNRYYANARGGVEMDRIVSPYLFAGVGLGFANLNTDFSQYEGNNPLIEQGIREDRSKGSSQTAFVLPLGGGIKFDLSNRLTIGIEFSGRLSFSDDLDGISASANPDNDDVYFFSGLNTYYRFFN
ncbi:MAG TPA: DUF6089 family protein [Saprospiraceae bacterium]|nr:DUF6089 family protein [Saprospiraceae bacterium]